METKELKTSSVHTIEGFKKTEVGIIPISWKTSELGEIIQFQGGSQPSIEFFKAQELEGYIRLIQIRDYKSDNNKTYIPRKLARRFCSSEDIMIGRYGPPIFQILRGLDGAYNVALIKAIPIGSINKDYCYHLLKQGSVFNFVEKLSQRSGGQTGIDLKELRTYLVPLPPTKAEQNAIVTALNDADALINAMGQIISKKRAIKQGSMQELLRPKKDWQVKKLGECLLQNPDYGINAASVPFNESLPVYLRITDITEDGRYSTQNIVSVNKIDSSKYYLKEGDLVFARTGASVGKTYLYKKTDGELVFAGFLIRVRPNPKILLPIYFQYYTQTAEYWNWIYSNSMRTGQPGINGKEFKELTFAFPSKEEQSRIAQILSDIDTEIQVLEEKIEKEKKIKQGMMQVILTGKIRLV